MLMLAAAVAGCTGEGTPARDEPAASVSEQVTVEFGQTIDFSMYTHCGVERAVFNGQTWEAVEPLYSSPDKIGPPDG